MTVDSIPLLAGAAALFIAGIAAWSMSAAWRASSRLYLRFAGVLLAALAVCAAAGLGDIAALFLLPLAAASLTLAMLARFARRLPDAAATFLLAGALGCGLGAALSGWPMLAVAPAVLCALAILAAALGGLAFVPAAGGTALLAAALAFLQQGAGVGVLLFAAAAVLGLARSSASAIDQQALQRQGRGAVGSLR